MALSKVFLTYGICVLLMPATLGRSLDQQSSMERELKLRILSRLLEAERQNIAELQEEKAEEKETVHKVEDKGNIIDVKVGDKLIEQHVQDCEQRYEMIVLDDDDTTGRQGACYLHKMEDTLYDFACKGKGERPYQTYYIGKEVLNKDVFPEDGPIGVCRKRPMFYIMPAHDLYQDNSPSIREFEKNKRCLVHCCSSLWGACVGWCIC